MAGRGQSRTGGRKKGTPNKTTRAVKDAIVNAFEKVGGEDYLAMVAKSDPKTFCSLLGRVLPSEIKADVRSSGEVLIERVAAARARLARAREEREAAARTES